MDNRLHVNKNDWFYHAISGFSRKSAPENFLKMSVLQPLTGLGLSMPSDAVLEVATTAVPIQEMDANAVLEALLRKIDAFPDTYRHAAQVATFAASTAVCESSFSSLTRIDRP